MIPFLTILLFSNNKLFSNDRWLWSLDGEGDFTVSSVRKAIDNHILPKGITKTRWIKEVPIKINIHAWKVFILGLHFSISELSRLFYTLIPAYGLALKVLRSVWLWVKADDLVIALQTASFASLNSISVLLRCGSVKIQAQSHSGEVNSRDDELSDVEEVSDTVFGNNSSSPFLHSADLANQKSEDPFNKFMFLAVSANVFEPIPPDGDKERVVNTCKGTCEAIGNSGGILCVWEASVFKKDYATLSDNFIAIYGTWLPSNSKVLFVAIYAPQHGSSKRMLWDYMATLISHWNGEGYAFTWSHPSGSKMSKLDRFLVSEGIFMIFPSITAICLERHLSDHRPIILCEVHADFGPTPFRFYHSWFNLEGFDTMKRSQLAIRGIFDDGIWCTNPIKVKEAFFNYFEARFKKPDIHRLVLNFTFDKRLSIMQAADLDRVVSRDEIRLAVWDCGENKSSGPDGVFPNGCNSSFVALIPKVLANRLALVISDLISDTQSAFVANRQILDGPFILNELLHWCKRKKKQAMFFKVDFAKAYDSVRWDYLLDVLEAFGFGGNWCNWIRGTFSFAKASILVNGSPTSEFPFYCGLKQGDPLSPYLFILVMESLHLSFNRAINEGIFKDANLKVPPDIVKQAAASIGCGILNNQFRYLGVMVGECMSSLKAWSPTLVKLRSRLSSWKVRTLSIGERLTLLKAVLGASPLYYLSIFKVPKAILNSMEAVRILLKNNTSNVKLNVNVDTQDVNEIGVGIPGVNNGTASSIIVEKNEEKPKQLLD
ncbi:RNA-directed DNA polymerase, eukaryota [Tanacetum coccineum]